MGPGIITGFAGNDAGGVTTYTAVGAHYGFEMMWLLLLSTAGLLVIQETCARMRADRPLPVTAPIRAHISWITSRPADDRSKSPINSKPEGAPTAVYRVTP